LLICLIPAHVYAEIGNQSDAENTSLNSLEDYMALYYQHHPDSPPISPLPENIPANNYSINFTVPGDHVSDLPHSSSQFQTDQKFGDTGCPYTYDCPYLCQSDMPKEGHLTGYWNSDEDTSQFPIDLYTSDCSEFTFVERKYPDSSGRATFTVNFDQPGGTYAKLVFRSFRVVDGERVWDAQWTSALWYHCIPAYTGTVSLNNIAYYNLSDRPRITVSDQDLPDVNRMYGRDTINVEINAYDLTIPGALSTTDLVLYQNGENPYEFTNTFGFVTGPSSGDNVQIVPDHGYLLIVRYIDVYNKTGYNENIENGAFYFPPPSNFTFTPENPRITDPVTFEIPLSMMGWWNCQWDFGDDSPQETGEVVVHRYQEVGTYDVTLHVSDFFGYTKEISKPVKVTIPVILVHGFNAGPETFYGLQSRLLDDGYQVINFDYSSTSSMTDPRAPAARLKGNIQSYRESLTFNGQPYEGKYDIVCHSMGALVTRWFMEELDGGEDVRQWIGIAPVNHGAATADFASMAPDWVKILVGSFQNSITYLKTDSDVVKELDKNHQSSGVKYRVIMGYNGNQSPLFFLDGGLEGLFGGKTWAMKKWIGIPTYYLTWLGDGIVANEQSKLAWAGTDSLSGYDHFMTNKPLVVNLVTSYIEDIDRPSTNIIPREEDYQQQFYINNLGSYWEGNVKKASTKIILAVLISQKDPSALFRINWLGSDLDLTLVSPSGERIGPDSNKVAEYVKTNNTIYYILNNPEPGEWKAEIDPVDMPENGEPVTFATFFNSSIDFGVTAKQNDDLAVGDIIPIYARMTDDSAPFRDANVWSEVTFPDSSVTAFPLSDEGVEPDAVPGDGIYSTDVPLSKSGFYSIKMSTNGSFTLPCERSGFLQFYVKPSDKNILLLYHGWNFVSVPQTLDKGHNTGGTVFGDVTTNNQPIWKYDAEAHHWLQIQNDTNVEPMEGIWIYSNDINMIPVYYAQGPHTPPVKYLYSGWNAIGLGSIYSTPVEQQLSTLGEKWQVLLNFDNSLQIYYPPAVRGHTNGWGMEPTKGYWIYMSEPGDVVATG
jgi:PKD repeat protein